MAYTDVITVEQVKDYLGVDGTALDNKISNFIKASFLYLEKVTNIHAVDKDETYYYDNGCVIVYDAPINTLDTDLDDSVSREQRKLYSTYTSNDTETDTLTLNIGYADPAQVPEDYRQCAFALIEWLFEGNELNDLPEVIKLMVGALKRYVI